MLFQKTLCLQFMGFSGTKNKNVECFPRQFFILIRKMSSWKFVEILLKHGNQIKNLNFFHTHFKKIKEDNRKVYNLFKTHHTFRGKQEVVEGVPLDLDLARISRHQYKNAWEGLICPLLSRL